MSKHEIAAFKVGDRVVRSDRHFNFVGIVTEVIMPDEIEEFLDTITENLTVDANDPVAVFQQEVKMKAYEALFKRDKSFKEYPIYQVTPISYCESKDKIAPYEEAKAICPFLTEEQYNQIVGKNERSFLCLDSDLLSAS